MIAALLLLHVDEETAFWGLSAVVEKILPSDYYSTTMAGALVSCGWRHYDVINRFAPEMVWVDVLRLTG